MSQNNKSDYAILITLGAIFAAAMAAMLLFGLVRNSEKNTSLSRTSLSSNIEGCLISYTLFEKIGLSVSRLDAFYQDEQLSQVGVLLLLEPHLPLRKVEVAVVQPWIARGGVLIVDHYPHAIESFCPPATLHLPEKKSEEQQENTSAISSIQQELPLARDVNHIRMSSKRIFKETAVDSTTTHTAVALLTDETGPRIMEYTYGKGKIIHVCDSSFMSNKYISVADNSILAVNLVSYAVAQSSGKTIAFDEYHQNRNQEFKGMSLAFGLLFTTPAGWSALVLTTGGLLYMVYRGRQFGPRFPLFSRKQRRSKMEFVSSVASVYQSCRACRLTLAILYKQFHENITTRTGLPPEASKASIAAALAQMTDHRKRDFYLETLSACEALLDKKNITHTQLETILDKLRKIEKEIINEYH